MAKTTRRKRTKRKLTEIEERQRQLRNAIRRVFSRAGFVYLPTSGMAKEFGSKRIEIDSVFIYENIILFCEDTVSHDTGHMQKKEDSARKIDQHFDLVLKWLKENHSEKFSCFNSYVPARYQKRYLYFSDTAAGIKPERFDHLTFFEPRTLRYFDIVTSALKNSARYELFRYLQISSGDVGYPESSTLQSNISVNIICPEENVGLAHGVRAVSFMMAPGDLLEYGYVLRKDNWETPNLVYQRLIEPNRVAKIRHYVATSKQSFLNNIIVALPADIKFADEKGDAVDIDSIQNYEARYKIEIPRKFNAIRIIDGQHRVFAYHEGEDALESEIAKLRNKLHLFVTALVFPPDMSDTARAQYESQLFLDINENAKKVSSDVILYIQELKDAFCPEGVARRVLKLMNEKRLFSKKLQLSTLDDAGIKTTSIIKFALKGLVAIEDGNLNTLFSYWTGNRSLLLGTDGKSKEAEAALDEYARFVCNSLCSLFSAVKSNFEEEWGDPESKIESVTSINGFLLAYKRTLPFLGVCDRAFYLDRLSNLKISFYRSEDPDEGFPYASSQYAMMADRVVSECFPEAKAE